MNKKNILGRKSKSKITMPGGTTVVHPLQADGFQTISGTIGTVKTHSADMKCTKKNVHIRKGAGTVKLTKGDMEHSSIAFLTSLGYTIK